MPEKVFITIDDLSKRADEITGKAQWLSTGLKELLKRKHPLDIRRGVGKGVSDMPEREMKYRKIEAKSKTYYFDLLTARNGNKYLKISETRQKAEGEEGERSSIVVFADQAEEFSNIFNDMIGKLLK